MSQTVTLDLPDEAVDRLQRSASAARMPLEQFLVERLTESVPPSADGLTPALADELRSMELLEDDDLWTIASASLSPAQQRRYDRLLDKNARSALTPREQETLREIGEEARLLTLKKAHACLKLKWRGHALPFHS
jgi:hypothetical protein